MLEKTKKIITKERRKYNDINKIKSKFEKIVYLFEDTIYNLLNKAYIRRRISMIVILEIMIEFFIKNHININIEIDFAINYLM